MSQRHRGKQRDKRLRSREAKRIEDRDRERNKNDQRKSRRAMNGEVRHWKTETLPHFSSRSLDCFFVLQFLPLGWG